MEKSLECLKGICFLPNHLPFGRTKVGYDIFKIFCPINSMIEYEEENSKEQ
jgi:hypothetical protein